MEIHQIVGILLIDIVMLKGVFLGIAESDGIVKKKYLYKKVKTKEDFIMKFLTWVVPFSILSIWFVNLIERFYKYWKNLPDS